ncbi:MAG TPA: hypothetical protein DCO79_05980, partial [Spirochaeta sp.]|nr:hypothetical protein [Spirochaeta sp.]
MKQIKIFLILILVLALSFSCASAGKDAAETTAGDLETVVENEVIDKTDASAIMFSGEGKKEPVIMPAESPDKHSRLEKSVDDTAMADLGEHLFESEETASGFGVAERVEPAPGIMADAALSSSAPAQASSSGLKAGYADDNRQYGYFLNFLEEYRGSVVPLGVDVSERITLKLTDADGKAVPGAGIKAAADKGGVTGVTLADGSYQINPSELFSSNARNKNNFMIEIYGGDSLPGFYSKLTVPRDGDRTIEIPAESLRVIPDPVPLDIVFVMDTTGSMGEEINRLKNTIQIIHMNLTSLSVAAEIRFGMVLYKDIGDDYRTQLIPLTSDIDFFQAALSQVEAFGGGDTPEDLEAALGELVKEMDWKPEAIKLSYVITDAPPHLDYQSSYSCA